MYSLINLRVFKINKIRPLTDRKDRYMSEKLNVPNLNLQMFAEGTGGDGGTGEGNGVSVGVPSLQGKVDM